MLRDWVASLKHSILASRVYEKLYFGFSVVTDGFSILCPMVVECWLNTQFCHCPLDKFAKTIWCFHGSINIDFHTRESTAKKIKAPTLTCFDEAQKVIYTLMEKDSYPRFLKSNIYLNLLNDLQANSLKWPVPGWRELKMVSRTEGMCQNGSLEEQLDLWRWLNISPRGRTYDSEWVNLEVIQAQGWRSVRWKLRDSRRKEILWFCHRTRWTYVLENPSELRRPGNSSYTETVNKGFETD